MVEHDSPYRRFADQLLGQFSLPARLFLSGFIDVVQSNNAGPQVIGIGFHKQINELGCVAAHAGHGVDHRCDPEGYRHGINGLLFQDLQAHLEERPGTRVDALQTLLHDCPIVPDQGHHIGNRAQGNDVQQVHDRLYIAAKANIQL